MHTQIVEANRITTEYYQATDTKRTPTKYNTRRTESSEELLKELDDHIDKHLTCCNLIIIFSLLRISLISTRPPSHPRPSLSRFSACLCMRLCCLWPDIIAVVNYPFVLYGIVSTTLHINYIKFIIFITSRFGIIFLFFFLVGSSLFASVLFLFCFVHACVWRDCRVLLVNVVYPV